MESFSPLHSLSTTDSLQECFGAAAKFCLTRDSAVGNVGSTSPMFFKIVRSWGATVLARDRGKATGMGYVVTGPGMSRT